MKIYTYYIDQQRAFQKEMIDVWEKSWKNKGFEPVVLGLRHAMAYNKYNETIQKLKFIYKFVTQSELSTYGEACYARWMAYAALNDDECFFVSDYDIVNNFLSLSACDVLPKNEITFFNRYCPCLVYGNSNTFKVLVEAFANENSAAGIQDIKTKFNKLEQFKVYHDQDFLQLNFCERFQENATKHKALFSPKLNFLNTSDKIYGIDPNMYCDSRLFDATFMSPMVSHVSSKLAFEYIKAHGVRNKSIDCIKYELMESCFYSSSRSHLACGFK